MPWHEAVIYWLKEGTQRGQSSHLKVAATLAVIPTEFCLPIILIPGVDDSVKYSLELF